MLVIAGTVRAPARNLEGLRPHMLAVLNASRAEDGCLVYSYAEDIEEPGLIRIFEVWRDRAALDAHARAPHVAAWRASWPAHGVCDRRLTAYEVAAETPL
jgi:quinol monooxygenase YgiN